jgi:beta-lysine 5,6-aminomutase alpha subunit
MSYSPTLPLSNKKVARCRSIAKTIWVSIAELIQKHSTVGTERAILRLIGLNGAFQRNDLWYPVANQIIDQLKEKERLSQGVLYWVANALIEQNCNLEDLELRIIEKNLNISTLPQQDSKKVIQKATQIASQAFKDLMKYRKSREALKRKLKDPAKEKRPLKYVIVATGNIFEDVLQAKSAVLDGADIIAVIRSTAQSLIDYVPHGTTTQGFGGTYATQANFRVMREALDELGLKLNKYIRLTNYCSGLCMSEIAALASLEGLDCLLNDAMYGILFRDINPRRTLIDQHLIGGHSCVDCRALVDKLGCENLISTLLGIGGFHVIVFTRIKIFH